MDEIKTGREKFNRDFQMKTQENLKKYHERKKMKSLNIEVQPQNFYDRLWMNENNKRILLISSIACLATLVYASYEGYGLSKEEFEKLRTEKNFLVAVHTHMETITENQKKILTSPLSDKFTSLFSSQKSSGS